VVTVEDVERARVRLDGIARRTPLIRSYALSRRLGADIFLKPEMLQRTGSFKLRGAFNKITSLSPAERERGVIAASAGNHAQGVAVAAALAGIPAVVVMPEHAPRAKVAAARDYGAEVILHGAHYREARARAEELRRERDMSMVHGFDDADVVAGQGTIGLEILDDLPEPDLVLVPVGGGGLIAGIAVALRARHPAVRIVGVQAARVPAVVESLRVGQPVPIPSGETIADGIAVERPGEIPFEIIRRAVDDVVTVTEEEIGRGIGLLLERTKLLAEGAGATPLAALLNGSVAAAGQNVVP
jgi:threonine dehydratase